MTASEHPHTPATLKRGERGAIMAVSASLACVRTTEKVVLGTRSRWRHILSWILSLANPLYKPLIMRWLPHKDSNLEFPPSGLTINVLSHYQCISVVGVLEIDTRHS
jgi:hypothetical protein